MATITTDTFLDGGTARTAGESWTIGPGTLTIRTDTRWHANAPASMTGTLGNTTLNFKAGFAVEGRNVRWMAYDTGTGNVPAIGTTITQGGVSGYLLGVWANYTSAPTAVGAAMPASGFLKFREVTGGPYSAGALTGIGANATSPDVAGWIEVVLDSDRAITTNTNSGAGISVTGDWFYLDNTTGTRGQTIQTPINGGGSQSPMPGVQIETAPGSGVYEWWVGVDSTYWTNATYKPAADSRSRIFGAIASGVIQLGHNGTSDTGHVPPAGCKVRIANVIFRMALAASRATNSNVSTSMTSNSRFINAAGSGNYTIDKASLVMGCDVRNSNTCALSNSIFAGMLAASTVKSLSITDCARGRMNAGYSSGSAFSFDSNLGAVTINKLRGVYGANEAFGMPLLNNANITALELCYLATSNSGPQSITVSGSTSTFTDTVLISTNFNITGNRNTFTNTDYIERLEGATTTTGSSTVFTLSGTYNKVDGLYWGRSGALSNVHPYAQSGVVALNAGFGHIVRNIGSAASPLSCGATSSTYPGAVVFINANVGSTTAQNKIQRCYVANTRNNVVNIQDKTVKNTLVESCYAVVTNSISGAFLGREVQLRDMYYGRAYDASGYGTGNSAGAWFQDNKLTGGAGQIYFGPNPPIESTSPYVDFSFTAGSGFDVNSDCYLALSGDYATFESYWIYGHTRLGSNAAGSASSAVLDYSTASITRQYQIDKGAGWGSWTTLNATNLFAEGVLSGPFRLKIRGTATTTSTSAALKKIGIPTAVSGSIVVAPYVLDTNTLTFTGLVAGSEVRAYTGTDPATAVEIGGTESSGTSFSFTHSAGGSVGYIRIFALGYQPYNYDPYTYEADDVTLLVQQTVDRNYVNP